MFRLLSRYITLINCLLMSGLLLDLVVWPNLCLVSKLILSLATFRVKSLKCILNWSFQNHFVLNISFFVSLKLSLELYLVFILSLEVRLELHLVFELHLLIVSLSNFKLLSWIVIFLPLILSMLNFVFVFILMMYIPLIYDIYLPLLLL